MSNAIFLAEQHIGMVGGMGDLSRALVRAYAALEEINRYNCIHNDSEAYLFDVAEWGMGQSAKLPSAVDFGLPASPHLTAACTGLAGQPALEADKSQSPASQ